MFAKFRILITRIFAVAMGMLLVFSSSAWDERMKVVLFSIGVLLVTAGAFGRLWCALYIAGYKNRKLVTDGPYSMTRNPLYFFSFVGSLGLGLVSESLIVMMVILLAFALYYPAVIFYEERFLQGKFGESFVTYKECVPRFFPRLSLYRDVEQCAVQPEKFRSHIYSAIWFILAVAIVRIIAGLHVLGVLPDSIRLY